MPSTTIQLNLFATIIPVSSPGGGSARIGTNLLETYEASGNSPIETQVVTASASTTTWDFDGANPINAVIGGESSAWTPRGILLRIGCVDATDPTTGVCQVLITDGATDTIDLEMGYGGMFFFKPFSTAETEQLVDGLLHQIAVSWDATAQANTNLTCEIFVVN